MDVREATSMGVVLSGAGVPHTRCLAFILGLKYASNSVEKALNAARLFETFLEAAGDEGELRLRGNALETAIDAAAAVRVVAADDMPVILADAIAVLRFLVERRGAPRC